MRRETARMKETTTTQWTISTVMPKSAVFIVQTATWKSLMCTFLNVLVSIKQVYETRYWHTSPLHDVIQEQFPSLKPSAGTSLQRRGKRKQ